jgi:REP element-mobilizing transposase RayT
MAILRSTASSYGYSVLAFCLMPDHLHLLVQAKENCKPLTKFVGAFKSLTARHYRQGGNEGKLWQRGFYEHIVRRDEDIEVIINYILANPVRVGLVEEPEEYPWAGRWDEFV